MDFDLGNIIYIIATLIAVGAGLFGNKKKKPVQQVPPGEEIEEEQVEQAAQPGFMESLERYLSGGQADPPVMTLHEDEEDLPLEEDIQEDDSPAQTGILAEYDRLMREKSDDELDALLADGAASEDQMEVLDLDEEDKADFFEVVKEFDATKAVVYAAIINRLDY